MTMDVPPVRTCGARTRLVIRPPDRIDPTHANRSHAVRRERRSTTFNTVASRGHMQGRNLCDD